MGFLGSKRLKYIAYMTGVVLLILLLFNTIFIFQIHKRLVKVVSEPGRWPVGAYIYDEKIGFDFAPNISGYIDDGSYYVKSHQLGYRIGEKEDAATFGPGGILSLGCSFTYGDEVEAGQTFTQFTSDAFQIPAYNYGICSFSYTHALLKARKLKEQGTLDKLQPRLVVLGCWSGLPDRSRSPFPPLASDNLPLPAAYLTKDANDVQIKYPMKLQHVFSMVELYRQEGVKMSFKKFFNLFFAAPEYVFLYLKNNRLAQQMKFDSFQDDVTDYEVYDYYFTGIEEVFSDYGSQIVVLFMPNRSNERPGDALTRAVDDHPGLIFVDGSQAIQKYSISNREYVGIHPQPRAHLAYAREIIERLSD